MTREEYESQKKVLLDQRAEIGRKLDELSKSYHDNELADAKLKYEGTNLLFYERMPSIVELADEFTIHMIEKVVCVGNGFITYDGIAYDIKQRMVNPNNYTYEISSRTSDEFSAHIRLTTLSQPDEELSNDEVNMKIAELVGKINDATRNAVGKG